MAKKSKKRIILSSLYLGNGRLESDLVSLSILVTDIIPADGLEDSLLMWYNVINMSHKHQQCINMIPETETGRRDYLLSNDIPVSLDISICYIVILEVLCQTMLIFSLCEVISLLCSDVWIHLIGGAVRICPADFIRPTYTCPTRPLSWITRENQLTDYVITLYLGISTADDTLSVPFSKP